MYLVHLLWFLVAHFDIYFPASYLPSLINIAADHLSLGNMAQAFTVSPTLTVTPTPFGREANLAPIVGLDITQFSSVISANNCIYLLTAITLL